MNYYGGVMSCEYKSRFSSLSKVKKFLKQRSKRYGGRFRSYFCNKCAGYHLTTDKDKNRFERKQYQHKKRSNKREKYDKRADFKGL